ncbi:MAG: dihydrofolate reductase [Candidatus Abawacabacteria bacterium]|nr:dihydrofolate reductase [Candidatus Abawacabacteria bacterium]
MKTILHLAISADGFIAESNGNSDWVLPADEDLFIQRAHDAGCLVVGKTTFQQYQNKIYPVKDVLNIVLTHDDNFQAKNIMVADSPARALQIAQEQGCPGLLIAGGAKTSATFLQANLLDEIFFSVHPLILGAGIKPFGGLVTVRNISLIGTKSLANGLVQLHYRRA